jgi:hypothetical protein
MTITEVFQRIITALENSGIEYMLTGSFASSRYGSPRATQDIDIVISATAPQIRSFTEHLDNRLYYVELDAALEAHRRQSLFNIIDLDAGWKIDLICRKSRPFSLEEFRRRRRVELHGLQLFVASAEDVIIAKLEWARMGASQRQIEDAASILRVQGDTLDKAYLEKWIFELELQEPWGLTKTAAGFPN